MSRFVRLGHYLINAEQVTYVRNSYDPRRNDSILHFGFASGSEVEVAAHALGMEGETHEVNDLVLEHVLEALAKDEA
jgi:hypothetical protein